MVIESCTRKEPKGVSFQSIALVKSFSVGAIGSIPILQLTLRTIFSLFFPTLSHGCFPETPFVSLHSVPYPQSPPFVFLDIFAFPGSHVEDER